eukprot:7628012-Pyramimonas_sp.AAC.1
MRMRNVSRLVADLNPRRQPLKTRRQVKLAGSRVGAAPETEGPGAHLEAAADDLFVETNQTH